MIFEVEIGIKLILSFAAGAFIGLDREVSGHPAGLRTMILVSAGSTTFVMMGFYGFDDPEAISRIIQGIATGLGFLGAGAIVKEGFSVKGLTTAASIWITAAIGGAIAIGEYSMAGLAFAVTIVSLSLVGYVERLIKLKHDTAILHVRSSTEDGMHERLLDVFKGHGMKIEAVKSVITPQGKILTYHLSFPRTLTVKEFLESLETVKNVEEYNLVDMDLSKNRLYP